MDKVKEISKTKSLKPNTLNHQSTKDFKESVKKYIQTKRTLLSINGKNYEDKFLPVDIIESCFLDCYNVKYRDVVIPGMMDNTIRVFYYQDPIEKIYRPVHNNDMLNRQIRLISDNFGSRYNARQLLPQFISNLSGLDIEDRNLEPLNINPNYIRHFKNGIINIKTKEFFEIGSTNYTTFLNKYDFISKRRENFTPLTDNDKIYVELFERFLNDFTDGNEAEKLLVLQILFACIEGFGRYKYFLFSGQPGCGKSTLMRIATIMAGIGYVLEFNIDKFYDDNYINNLSETTALVKGDDLVKNADLKGDGLSKFKMLVDGNPTQVKVKFEPNKIVQTQAVWIQSMNDDLNIHEANEAITDRAVIFRVSGKNHRLATSEESRSISNMLDKLTGKLGKSNSNNRNIVNYDLRFAEVIIAYVISKVDYFEQFDIPSRMKADTERSIKEGNWAYSFGQYLKDEGFFDCEYIPYKVCQHENTQWLRENNPSMRQPSTRTLNKEMISVMKEFGFEQCETQLKLSTIKSWQFHEPIFNDNNGYDLGKPQSNISYWHNPNNKLTDDFVLNYLKQHDLLSKSEDDLTVKDLLVINYAVDKLDLKEYLDKVKI